MAWILSSQMSRSRGRARPAAWFAGLALAAGMAATGSAHAVAQVVLGARDPSQTPATASLTQTDPVIIRRSLDHGGSIAVAEADLSAGILRAAATAAPGGTFTSLSSLTSASAMASLGDAIGFGAGSGGTALLDWRFEGRIATSPDASGDGPYSQGFLDINLFPIAGGSTIHLGVVLTNGPNCPANTTHCYNGTAVDVQKSLPVPIVPGGYAMSAMLTVVARQGDAVEFDHTAAMYFRLPPGATLTSASGVFLSQAVPLAPVPEPSQLATALAGLVLVGWCARRRGGVRSSPATIIGAA